MKKITALLLLIVLVTVSHSQTTLQGTYWHNGDCFTLINSETDTTVVTFTANLHEGADGIPWKKTANPNLYMRPNQIGNAWTDTIIYYRDSIVHKTVEGQEVLLIYGRERTLKDILLRYEGRSTNKWYEQSHGFDSVLESNIRRQIMGSYFTGKQEAWRITSDSLFIFSLSSLPDLPSFSYAYTIRWGETDRPERILTLSDGRNLCFEMTADGLNIYNGIIHVEPENDIEWISQGDLLCHLNKTHLDNAVPGRWPEASTTILTRGYLELYPTDVLRLIRNEIYARHGHSFTDKQLTEFYSKEGLWYGTALLQQNPTELTETENLNVQLILAIEKERTSKQAKR